MTSLVNIDTYLNSKDCSDMIVNSHESLNNRINRELKTIRRSRGIKRQKKVMNLLIMMTVNWKDYGEIYRQSDKHMTAIADMIAYFRKEHLNNSAYDKNDFFDNFSNILLYNKTCIDVKGYTSIENELYPVRCVIAREKDSEFYCSVHSSKSFSFHSLPFRFPVK